MPIGVIVVLLNESRSDRSGIGVEQAGDVSDVPSIIIEDFERFRYGVRVRAKLDSVDPFRLSVPIPDILN